MNTRRRTGRWRSSTVRLSLLYLALLLASVSALFGFFYWSTNEFLARQTDATIDTEIAGLRDRFRSGGLPGLRVLIANRVGRGTQGPSLYLLTDSQYGRVAGNLPAWPDALDRALTAGGRWREFDIAPSGESGTPRRVRARTFSLREDFKLLVNEDFFLLVGRDIQDLVVVRARMLRAFGWGFGITVILGALGSVWISSRFARRIERINRASREIMTGDLTTRIPADGAGDDLDELVAHWNEMLEQIETLMAGVRHVSDNIAHDLRTPLARLRNELEAARAATEDNPTLAREHLGRSISEADALLSTFSALLRIARIEAGERRAGFGPVELSKLVADVVELYEPVAEERGQTIEQQIRGEAWVRGDRDLLFQAIANLVDNAVKYSPEGGAIRLALDRSGDASNQRTLVSVTDSGPGIATEDRPRVLERFFRVEASRSTPGNGLGLALVAAVAKLHGAGLRLEDAAPGLRVSMAFESEPASAS